MLYPFLLSLRGGTRDSGGEGPERLFPQGHSCAHVHRLAKAPQAGLRKQNLANQAEQSAEPDTKKQESMGPGCGLREVR